MKKPSTKTRMLGHPLVVTPALTFFLWSGYQWLMQPEAWPMAAAALCFLAPVMNAHEKRHAYMTWRRAWEGLGDQAPQRRPILRPLTGMMVIVAAALYLVATLDRVDTQNGLALMALVGIAASIGFVLRVLFRRRARTRAAKAARVTVCVRKPLVRVPTLQQAYAALPDHCRAVMGGC